MGINIISKEMMSNKRILKTYLALCFCFITLNVFTQKVTNSIHKKSEFSKPILDSLVLKTDSIRSNLSSFEVGINVQPQVVYWGRTFGLKQNGLDLALLFTSKKGLFVYSTFYYWSMEATPNTIAFGDIGIGYEKEFKKNIYASISYEKWLTFNGEDYVNKALNNAITLQTSFDFNWFNFSAIAYNMFGKYNVLENDFLINKKILLNTFSKKCLLFIKPEISSVFANKNFLPIYGDFPHTYDNRTNYKLIDIETNLPVRLLLNNAYIEPAFHYAFPVNQVNENLTPFFYFTFKIAVKLYVNEKLPKTPF